MRSFKLVLIIGFSLVLFNSLSQNSDEKEDIDFDLLFSDSEPSFPGGEDSLINFLIKNTKFPDTCLSLNSNGRVLMRFYIEPDGSITKITVDKNTTGCDQFSIECIRVISMMPRWIPPEENGNKRRSLIRLPFTFKSSN
jgi:protein TonB